MSSIFGDSGDVVALYCGRVVVGMVVSYGGGVTKCFMIIYCQPLTT